MVSGQERCGPANDVSAVKGDWLLMDHAGRLKFQSRLVVTGAIVIGQDDGISSTSLIATIQMRSKTSWRTTTGRADYWGRAPLTRVVGFVRAFSTSARQHRRMKRECRDPIFL